MRRRDRHLRCRPTAVLVALSLVAGPVAGCTSSSSGRSPESSTEPSAEPSAATSAARSAATSASAAPPTASAPPPSTSSTPTTAADSQPPTIEDPPAPLALTGDRVADATALADAFEHRDPARLPALLAAYQLAGIPVADGRDSAAGAGDAAVGVPWAIVNAAAWVPDERVRVSLTDVVRLLHVDGLDLDVAAADLTAGLRAALADTASAGGVGPIAQLVAEETLRYNGVSLLDPATAAGNVFVTMPTAALLVSAGIFGVIATADNDHRAADPPASSGFRRAVTPAAATAPGGCTFDSAFGQWAVWIVSKVVGGVSVPGLEWGGVFGAVANAVLSQSASAIASAVAGWVGTALTVVTTVVAAMTFSALVRLEGGEPLVRTHSSTTRGAVDSILVTVMYDFGMLGADTVNALNCILFVLIAIGNNATFPTSGAVGAGVPVTIHGERPGFGEGLDTTDAFVELDTPLTSETDDSGTARFTVAGRTQKRTVPDSAESYERMFTVALSAKPDPTDANSIMKTFLDSVLCVPGTVVNPGACADPITDILRQFNWDLGRWSFSLTDWRSGWAIHDSLHPEQSAAGFMYYDGVSCESQYGPWHIVVSFTEPGNIVQDVSFDVVLNTDGTGTVSGTEYSTWDDGLVVNGTSSGTAQLTKVGVSEGEYELSLDYTETVTWTYVGRSWLDTQHELHHLKTIKVIPATQEECD